MIEHKEIKAGLDGLPPIKDQYETKEKKLIAEAADKYGARKVAQAYGLKWQTVVAWKKHYGDKATMATMSAFKNAAKKSAVKLIIQSPAGQEVTIDELLERISKSAEVVCASGATEATEAAVDTVYIRADEGKAYWVRETENGAVELW